MCSERHTPMKWLFLTNSAQFGGLETRSLAIAQELLRTGHRITFLCCGANTYSKVAEESPERCKVLTAPRTLPHSISIRSMWRAWRQLKREKVNAVFIFNYTTPCFLAFLAVASIAGVRHVVVHHGGPPVPPPKGLGGRYLGGLVRGLHFITRTKRLFARFVSGAVTQALFNNSEEQDQWVTAFRYASSRSDLWLPPIAGRQFLSAQAGGSRVRAVLNVDDSCVFGSVGRLAPCKRFDDLARAFAIARKSLPNARLIIVGDGAERVPLHRLLEQLHLTDAVLLLGAKEDVVPFLGAMDVFVLPSSKESLGIVIVEAMAAGVPVIVTDLPGPRRLVLDGQAGLIVPVRSPEKLAGAMIRLAKNRELRNQLVEKGVDRAKECDVREVVRKLLAWQQNGHNLHSSEPK